MNGFWSFSISDVEKTFMDKTSAGKQLYSPSIESLGFEWNLSLKRELKGNEFFGIYLYCKRIEE